VTSVATLLVSRLLLYITGFPKISFGDVHVAHVLFGGVFMTISLLIQSIYIGHIPSTIASYLGGIGFGLFLDELGKFLSQDNDYFYQPAVVIMYLLFVLFFYFLRYMKKKEQYYEEEKKVHVVIARAEGTFSTGVLVDLQRFLRRQYAILAEKKWFQQILLLILWGYLTGMTFSAGRALYGLIAVKFDHFPNQSIARFYTEHNTVIVSLVIQFISHVLAALCIAYGTFFVKSSRLKAYSWYMRATYVWIFVTQVFMFYNDQFSAVQFLFFSILMFGALSYMRDEERRKLLGKIV